MCIGTASGMQAAGHTKRENRDKRKQIHEFRSNPSIHPHPSSTGHPLLAIHESLWHVDLLITAGRTQI
jgi:hypothetical protein